MYLLSFMVGACLGSFTWCISEDIAQESRRLLRRSSCCNCQHPLTIFDLIPVISYLQLGGYCRYCQVPLSRSYLWVELIGGIVTLIASSIINETLFINFLFISIILAVMSFCDWKVRWVPDWLQLLLLVSVVSLVSVDPSLHLNVLLFLIFLFFTIILICMECQYIGGADLKLITTASLILDINDLPTFIFLASCLGLIYYTIYKPKDKIIPFIPMLTTSLWIMLIKLLI